MEPHKHAAVIKAWADGAEIQCRSRMPPHRWVDVDPHIPVWYDDVEYRVKPKAPQIVELFASGGGGKSCQWLITAVAQERANLRLSFDPDSGELLSVEKL